MIAIDPGTLESAVVEWDGSKIGVCAILPNHDLVEHILYRWGTRDIVIERFACYGMPVGEESIATILWTGRMIQAHKDAPDRHKHNPASTSLIYRREVKMHICQQAKAKDSNIIQALKDRFGAKSKTNPITGKLKADMWQAFALAVTAIENPELVRTGRI